MEVYRVTVRLEAESKAKAEQEIYLRVPNGKICAVRKEANGKEVKNASTTL